MTFPILVLSLHFQVPFRLVAGRQVPCYLREAQWVGHDWLMMNQKLPVSLTLKRHKHFWPKWDWTCLLGPLLLTCSKCALHQGLEKPRRWVVIPWAVLTGYSSPSRGSHPCFTGAHSGHRGQPHPRRTLRGLSSCHLLSIIWSSWRQTDGQSKSTCHGSVHRKLWGSLPFSSTKYFIYLNVAQRQVYHKELNFYS